MSAESPCHGATGSCHGPTIEEAERAGWFDQQGGIIVTINPEARVSVIRVGPSLRAPRDGGPIRVPVRVINKGLVTAPLRAVLLRPGHESVEVSLAGGPLGGAPQESLELELRAIGGDPLDVTIAFEISAEGGDLAGRDRVHLLLRSAA